jgi:N-acetylmuramoyl-L-alanine amidase
VVIDPGHGGKDLGAPKFKVAMVEKEVVLDISLRLGNKIKQEFPDVKVVYTRSSDASVTLKRRWETADTGSLNKEESRHEKVSGS